jgi:hypothetical protein
MATAVANTDTLPISDLPDPPWKRYKILVFKNITSLTKKDKYTKIVPNTVFFKNTKNFLQKTQKLRKICFIKKCLQDTISLTSKNKKTAREKMFFLIVHKCLKTSEGQIMNTISKHQPLLSLHYFQGKLR